jgi:RNA polymerase sigma-54 factor
LIVELSLQPKLAHDLKLSPEQLQGLAILELSWQALEIELRAACEANPFLEEDPEEEVFEAGEQTFDEPVEELQGKESELEIHDLELWLEYFVDALNTNDDESALRAEWTGPEAVAPAPSLGDELLAQIAAAKVEPLVREVARLIVGNLDEDGFLRATVEEIAAMRWDQASPRLQATDVERALAFVRSLDPAGIAWWTLQESLLAQLRARGHSDLDLPFRIVLQAWEHLCSGRLRIAAEKLGVSRDELAEGLSVIHSLELRPGARFARSASEGQPIDLVVRRVDGCLRVDTNDRGLPRLRISRGYQRMLRTLSRGDSDHEARCFLQANLESGKTLLRNLQRRGETLERVGRLLFEQQSDFLDRGPVALRPLSMTYVAEALALHVSTVSRAVANKYVATPCGTFPLRYFFDSSLPSTDGGAPTPTAARERVRGLIATEPAAAPLTDAAIRARLQQEGIELAASTVRKYRETLAIPASHIRRQLRLAG